VKQGDVIEVLGRSFDGLVMRETGTLAIIENVGDGTIMSRYLNARPDGVTHIRLDIAARDETYR
jgi:hypothetical protein